MAMRYKAPAVIVAALFHVGTTFAAGQFDGEWNGQTSKVKKCKAIDLKATVIDGKVTIDGTSPTMHFTVRGTVKADGTFKGGPRWEGKFTSDMATGLHHDSNCGETNFTLSKVK